jgi:hypothetical protein
MAEHHGELGRVDLVIAQMEVGPADCARLDRQDELTRSGFGVGQRPLLQRLTGALEHDRSH